MMKIEIFYCGLALIWGLALGLFYFGGLWWTLRIFTQKPVRDCGSGSVSSYVYLLLCCFFGLLSRKTLEPFLSLSPDFFLCGFS
ncbi:MAG: hypothetical protein J7K32_02265 [Deltaproteobacteria bacterium]|nr:hypothetical protein [Deltaproteobacteria bacterium]